MKIKRFFSSDMRNVIRMVREELGPDAVILSNNRVNGGVEVVAAVDYDETIFSNNVAQPQQAQAGQSPSPATSQESAYRSAPAEPHQTPISRAITQNDAITNNNSDSNSDSRPAATQQKPVKRIPEINTSELDDLTLEQKQNSDFSFYLLGDDDPDAAKQSRLEDTLYETPFDGRFPDSDARETSDKSNVWSQEPTLVEMRNEVRTLRSLLEKQLSGLAWGDFARNNPIKAKLLRQLLELELSPKLAGAIADAVNHYEDYEKSWQYALRLFASQLPVMSDDLIARGGIVSLVGPTGVGKTTSIAKLAARYALRHGRNNVALVTTDSFRIAAHEQLKTYGRILGMPVRIASTQQELAETLQGFSDKDLILIDTAGMSHRDMRLIEQFNMISESAPAIQSLLVMSATTHRAGLDEIVRIFRNVDLDGCVLTKVDETTNLAGCLSTAIEHRLPIVYIGNGQKVPEDLHLARAHSLVNQAVLIARKTNHHLENESLELAFSRVTSNAYV